MYVVDTSALSFLSDLTFNLEYRKIVPSNEEIQRIILKFEPIKGLDFEKCDFYDLEQQFNFSYIEFSNEDTPYEHKPLGIAIIALISCTSYSDQIMHSLGIFVLDHMKNFVYLKTLELVAKSIFPSFTNDIDNVFKKLLENKKQE
jgi:hypothetical protein